MKIIRLKEVLAITGLSKSTIYERMPLGEFPRSVSLGGSSVGWVESEVSQWVSDRIAERDGGFPCSN